MGGTPQAALIKEIVEFVGNLVNAVVGVIDACNSIYNAMDATRDALDTPGIPQGTRDQLNENLGHLVESAGKLGCP
jgi:hypothetical protein